ncbi:MAG: adenylate kinase family protein [Candidatus Hodarchaeota archaeon]
MSALLIGGSPGTGKTIVAKALASRLSVRMIALSELADQSGCVSLNDTTRDTGIIDEDCLVAAIEKEVEDRSKQIIIEGHYIDLVPSRSVDKVFLLRTHPETLRERLQERKWSKAKVAENVEAEVLGVCQLDAVYSFGEEKVFEIDTTDMNSIGVVERIQSILKTPDNPVRIDWMALLESEGRADEFLSE